MPSWCDLITRSHLLGKCCERSSEDSADLLARKGLGYDGLMNDGWVVSQNAGTRMGLPMLTSKVHPLHRLAARRPSGVVIGLSRLMGTSMPAITGRTTA
jgi:hypothetical protein